MRGVFVSWVGTSWGLTLVWRGVCGFSFILVTCFAALIW